MTIDDVLADVTDDEAAELLRRIEDDREWKAFFHGVTMALALVRDREGVSVRLRGGLGPDDFIDDLKMAVSAVLLRCGHDVADLPDPDVLSAIGALTPEPVGAGAN